MDSDQRKARLADFKAMNLGDLRDCATEMYRILREDDANLDALRARVKALEAALENANAAAARYREASVTMKLLERGSQLAAHAEDVERTSDRVRLAYQSLYGENAALTARVAALTEALEVIRMTAIHGETAEKACADIERMAAAALAAEDAASAHAKERCAGCGYSGTWRLAVEAQTGPYFCPRCSKPWAEATEGP